MLKCTRFVGMAAAATVAVAATSTFASDVWHVPGDFATIQMAIDDASVVTGDKIMVAAGEHDGAIVTKGVEIKGEGGATITGGPAHGSGLSQGFRFMAGGDGATLSHLAFAVDLAIMNGAAVDDVTVTQCTFENAVQAVSNWGGNRWEISHNTINDLRTRCGGGIGILVADYTGGYVQDNVVSHNKITGTLHVSDGDCGGYSGTGIVLYADFRWTRIGATEISWNRVVKNKVNFSSDNPGLVDAVAFELTDTRNISGAGVIVNNTVGFNEWRNMTNQVSLTPADLGDTNPISRNLGDNRGHGLHPGVLFGPHD